MQILNSKEIDMKNFIYIYIIASLVLFSCQDDFLESQPTEFISSDRFQSISDIDPTIQEASLRGIYSSMYQTGTGGTTGHDDFGQKGYDIFSDMLSSDMVLGAKIYGWYSGVSDLQVTVDFTSTRNYMIWRYYYRIILGANAVIGTLGGNDFVPEEDGVKAVMGQAKALRAYAYFYLANLMAEEYDPSVAILPIYTEVTDVPSELKSTQEVYKLILDDLETAVEYLDGYARPAKYAIDKYVAEGLLAYAYSVVGEHEKAAAAAKDAALNGGFSILTMDGVTEDGFNSVESPSWMWGVDITTDYGLDLVSWWGQVDLFTYSYAWAGDGKIINDDLYDAIANDDARKAQFVNAYGDGQKYPINKFYDPGRQIGGQRSITSDYVYMRVEEMYLLWAENAYKSGNEAAAREALKELMENRVSDASYIDVLSGQNLLDEIILQTRIELWGEGKSYLSMKRNKLTITLGSNHLTYPGVEIDYNDDRLTFEIPQSEIQNNPLITGN